MAQMKAKNILLKELDPNLRKGIPFLKLAKKINVDTDGEMSILAGMDSTSSHILLDSILAFRAKFNRGSAEVIMHGFFRQSIYNSLSLPFKKVRNHSWLIDCLYSAF